MATGIRVSQQLIEELRQEIANQRVIAIVGAGVSIGASGGAGLASWRGLLEHGIGRCEAVGEPKPQADWADTMGKLLASDMTDLLTVAEQVAQRLGAPEGAEYGRWLDQTVGSLRVEEGAVLEALRGLGIPIATTNYDSLIEQVTGWDPLTWRDQARVLKVLRGEAQGVLHLHGHYAWPDTVVLGIGSYEDVVRDAHAQAVQQAIAVFNSVLFIGFGQGLDDPNFGKLIEWINRVLGGAHHRHYRLVREDEAEAVGRRGRVVALSYGAGHAELAPFLLGLAPAEKPKAPPPAAPAEAIGLPAQPRCLGRDVIVEELVAAVLEGDAAPTPVLGGPGIGKSTVCLAALHDPRIARTYGERRYFVRLDGATSADAMVAEIAKAMAIPLGPDLPQRVMAELGRAPTVLALDNAETPWEGDLAATEEMFGRLSGVPGLAFVATLRGQQRPGGVSWRGRIDVPPLPDDSSRDLFLEIAGTKFSDDPHLGDLLGALDGLPLAVELMAYAAETEPTLESLWQRWRSERTRLLKRGPGDTRLLNLGVSLEVSMQGPRMSEDARRLLCLMGPLPDGVSHGDLDALLPAAGARAAADLRQTGLAFDEGGRLRMLAPVREHVKADHPPSQADLQRSVAHFAALARLGDKLGKVGGDEAARRLSGDASNIEAQLDLGLGFDDPAPAIDATLAFANFQRLTGVGATRLLERAAEIAHNPNHAVAEAKCIERLGHIAFERSDHEGARVRYDEALPLYRKVGSVLGEATCIQALGNIALARSDYDGARTRYDEALPLYREAGGVLGEANCIKGLGDIARERSDHEGARARYEEALPLCRRVGAVLGEANCIYRLGDIALERADHEGARTRYDEALPLYRQVGDVLGEANCIARLGEIALACSDHAGTRARFEEALPLYREVGDVLGEANCIQSLGDIARARSDHEGARARYEEALALYERIEEPHSIGALQERLALVAPSNDERTEHLRAARDAWASIGRQDLIETLPDMESPDAT